MRCTDGTRCAENGLCENGVCLVSTSTSTMNQTLIISIVVPIGSIAIVVVAIVLADRKYGLREKVKERYRKRKGQKVVPEEDVEKPVDEMSQTNGDGSIDELVSMNDTIQAETSTETLPS